MSGPAAEAAEANEALESARAEAHALSGQVRQAPTTCSSLGLSGLGSVCRVVSGCFVCWCGLLRRKDVSHRDLRRRRCALQGGSCMQRCGFLVPCALAQPLPVVCLTSRILSGMKKARHREGKAPRLFAEAEYAVGCPVHSWRQPSGRWRSWRLQGWRWRRRQRGSGATTRGLRRRLRSWTACPWRRKRCGSRCGGTCSPDPYQSSGHAASCIRCW